MPAPNSSDIVTWLRSGLLPGHSETVQRLMNMSADLIEQLQRDLEHANIRIDNLMNDIGEQEEYDDNARP